MGKGPLGDIDTGRLGWLAAELLVVFAGVTLAFLLEGHRTEREAVERRRAIVAVVIEDLGEIAEGARRASEEAGAVLAAFGDTTRPSRPVPRPISPFVPFRPYVWDAALETGAIRALPPERMLQLSGFYGRVEEMLRSVERAAATSRELLLPELDGGADVFYVGESRRLRPRFRWYLDYFRRLERQASSIAAGADSLRAALRDDLAGG